MLTPKTFLLIATAFVGGLLLPSAVAVVHAQGTESNRIYACIRPTIFNAPNIRIVPPDTECRHQETLLSWPKDFPSSGNSAIICVACEVEDLLSRANVSSLVGVNLDLLHVASSDLRNADFSGASLIKAVMNNNSLDNINFSGANLTEARLKNSGLTGSNFSGANLTNASFKNSGLVQVNFTGANLQGTNLFNTALIETNFTNANLTGALNVNTANRENPIWSNTICPDGTNSDANGNTCEGHLTP